MNNDDIYGLNHTSPLSLIYNRGRRSIFAPRMETQAQAHAQAHAHSQRAAANLSTPQHQQTHVAHQQQQQQQPQQQYDANASVRVLEQHLQALRDIDRRLSVLSERDDLLQAKVRNQELQLERLQNSMRLLFEQNETERKFQRHQEQLQQRPLSGSAVGVYDKLANTIGAQQTPAADCFGKNENTTLIAIGVGIVALLFAIVALMAAKWQHQKKKERRAREASEIQQNVKQAVFDVLSQSQSEATLSAATNPMYSMSRAQLNRPANRNNLTNSYSLPVAFGP